MHLKGQCHEIFRFWFFSSISFPPAPEYPIRTVSNFFEISRRYSQLKVDHRCRWHRWQMRKIFNQKNFNNFVGTPLDSRVNTYIYIFAFKFTLRYLQQDINPIVCHRCLWHRWQICRRCRWYRWQFATGVVNTGGKFAAGIVDTGGKFATGINNTSETGGKICHRCRWYRWSTLSCEYLREFSKKWYTQGLGGNWFMKKTRSKKSRDTVPLKGLSSQIRMAWNGKTHFKCLSYIFSCLSKFKRTVFKITLMIKIFGTWLVLCCPNSKKWGNSFFFV